MSLSDKKIVRILTKEKLKEFIKERPSSIYYQDDIIKSKIDLTKARLALCRGGRCHVCFRSITKFIIVEDKQKKISWQFSGKSDFNSDLAMSWNLNNIICNTCKALRDNRIFAYN